MNTDNSADYLGQETEFQRRLHNEADFWARAAAFYMDARHTTSLDAEYNAMSALAEGVAVAQRAHCQRFGDLVGDECNSLPPVIRARVKMTIREHFADEMGEGASK